MNKWLVLKIRAWLKIENEEHRHWCLYKRGDEVIPNEERCYHSGSAWYCTDPFCADVDRKDCPNCVAGRPKTCKGGGVGDVSRPYIRCTCGLGRN
jgi:hypothetical protein